MWTLRAPLGPFAISALIAIQFPFVTLGLSFALLACALYGGCQGATLIAQSEKVHFYAYAHKHQRDPKKTYKQITSYRVAIQHAALSQGGELPIIVNCIFYHGRQGWEKQQSQGIYKVAYDAGFESIDPVPLSFYVLDLERLDISLLPTPSALYSILYALLKVQQFGGMGVEERRRFFGHFFSHLELDDTATLMGYVMQYISDACGLGHREVYAMVKDSGAVKKEYIEHWDKHVRNPWKEEGRVEGLDVGLKKGLEKGRTEGRAEERVAVAASMLKKGLKLSVISEVTGLSPDEIKVLKSR